MSSQRVEVLKKMVDQDPNSVLARYGLAMEYVNSGDNQAAVEEFEKLIASNPDYAAAYYHGGRTLEKLQRLDEARQFYERGMKVTARTGDGHTYSELQAALDMLGLA